jgi:hypothetical protein
MMKKTVPKNNPLLNKASSLLVVMFALIGFSSIKPSYKVSAYSGLVTPKEITVSTLFQNKNYQILMVSSASLRQLLITAGPQQKKVYHFYLFDIDGKLKVGTPIHGNRKTAIVNISNGEYLFEIYNDDRLVEQGKLAVK